MKIKYYVNLSCVFLLSLSAILLKFSPNYAIAEENINFKNYEEENSSLTTDYLKQVPKNDYILGPGDSIAIKIERNYPELNTSTLINGEGTIFLPLIGKVYVKGLTISELNKLLSEMYLKHVNFLDVEVTVLQYRPIEVIVNGEVNNPGIQILSGALQVAEPIEKDLDNIFKNSSNNEINDINKEINFRNKYNINYYFPTVFDAIRSSGGITINSDLSNIKITRINNISNGGGKIMTSLNFNQILNSEDLNQNIRIYDGDIITINKSKKANKLSIITAMQTNLNPKYISVNIFGRVNNPGIKKITKLSTLNDAIEIAGGAKALRGNVKFISFNKDGNIEKRKISYRKSNKRGTNNNPYLNHGDMIMIGNSLASSSAEVINEFTEPFKGIFSVYGLIKAINDN